jgi:site-specific DNA recombinase
MLGRKATGVAGSRSTPAGTAAEAATGIENQGVAGAEGERGLLIAALYARVSTDKQERNETIASQLDALQRAAAEGGYVVAPEHVFVDAHHSGGRLDRPALDRLRDHAAEGVFEVVLAYSPDRLARQYAHQVLVIEELQRVGCRVVFSATAARTVMSRRPMGVVVSSSGWLTQTKPTPSASQSFSVFRHSIVERQARSSFQTATRSTRR